MSGRIRISPRPAIAPCPENDAPAGGLHGKTPPEHNAPGPHLFLGENTHVSPLWTRMTGAGGPACPGAAGGWGGRGRRAGASPEYRLKVDLPVLLDQVDTEGAHRFRRNATPAPPAHRARRPRGGFHGSKAASADSPRSRAQPHAGVEQVTAQPPAPRLGHEQKKAAVWRSARHFAHRRSSPSRVPFSSAIKARSQAGS